jgi:hypothetical protein
MAANPYWIRAALAQTGIYSKFETLRYPGSHRPQADDLSGQSDPPIAYASIRQRDILYMPVNTNCYHRTSDIQETSPFRP